MGGSSTSLIWSQNRSVSVVLLTLLLFETRRIGVRMVLTGDVRSLPGAKLRVGLMDPLRSVTLGELSSDRRCPE